MDTPKPSLGRIVIYKSPEGVESPAIITEVYDVGVNLTVFESRSNPRPISYIVAQGNENDQWNWPKKV